MNLQFIAVYIFVLYHIVTHEFIIFEYEFIAVLCECCASISGIAICASLEYWRVLKPNCGSK